MQDIPAGRFRSPELLRNSLDPPSTYGIVGKYAWEIDHKNPVSKGGTDNITYAHSLHPLFYQLTSHMAERRPVAESQTPTLKDVLSSQPHLSVPRAFH